MTTTGSYASDYFENTIINHVLRSASASGSSAWLALETLNPKLENDEGKTGYEANPSGSYTRQSLLNNMTMTNGSATLTSNLSFWTATNLWASYELDIFTIRNGSTVTAGSILIYGPVTYPRYIGTQSQASVKKGFLSFSMYGGITPYLAQRIFSHYFTNTWQYITPGSSVYLGLYSYTLDSTGVPTTSGSFEISASAGYRRMEVGNSGSWSIPSTGSTSNTQDIFFTYNADSEWGKIYGATIFDHPDSGSALFQIPFSASRIVNEGDGFKIGTGTLKIYID